MGHDMQAAEPAPEYLSAGHSLQVASETAALIPDCFPAAQRRQVAALVAPDELL
jgi:hypothetical protein